MSPKGVRGGGSFADALRTMGVLGALLIASFFVGQIMTVKPDRPPSSVNLTDAVTGARSVARFTVVAPKALPKGWAANSTRFTAEAWHLGVLTPDNEYIGLEQERSSPRTVLNEFAPKSRPAGTVDLAGRTWQRRAESDGDAVYVRTFGRTTVLVIGSAQRAELERYVASLSPTGPAPASG